MPYPCLYHCRGAHIARLKRDIYIAILEPPGTKSSTGLADCNHLGMKCDILTYLTAVIAACDDMSVMYDDTADRGFLKSPGLLRLQNSSLHESVMICLQHIDMITRKSRLGLLRFFVRLLKKHRKTSEKNGKNEISFALPHLNVYNYRAELMGIFICLSRISIKGWLHHGVSTRYM